MSCREFFEENRENKEKCKLLQNMNETDLAQWETVKASKHSPGVVEDGETLYQQIVDPTHIAPNGSGLKPTAFDAASSHGLSTNRIKHSSWQALVERGDQRADTFNHANPERPKRSLWGFAPYPISEVRRIISTSTKTRGFFVFDTANEDDISHADICQCAKDAKDQRGERSVRFSLYNLVKGSLIPRGQVEE